MTKREYPCYSKITFVPHAESYSGASQPTIASDRTPPAFNRVGPGRSAHLFLGLTDVQLAEKVQALPSCPH